MSDYTIFAIIVLSMLASWVVGMLVTEDEEWMFALWNGMKNALRRILTTPQRLWSRDSNALEIREPDWADAADEVGFFDPFDHELLNVRAWTTEEREVYGINDTDRLIDAIQQELNDIEWQRLRGSFTAPPSSGRLRPPRETASERQIRRAGAQITAGVLDYKKVDARSIQRAGQ